jgi:hypothetical protein
MRNRITPPQNNHTGNRLGCCATGPSYEGVLIVLMPSPHFL